MQQNKARLELSEQEMKNFGYTIVDAIVDHHLIQDKKLPVAQGSREEMDSLFLEEAPEQGSDPGDVLNFVVDKVMSNSTLLSHPKMYSFVPGPNNYVSVMADSLATGFNIFSGLWKASPAANELEILTDSMVVEDLWFSP